MRDDKPFDIPPEGESPNDPPRRGKADSREPATQPSHDHSTGKPSAERGEGAPAMNDQRVDPEAQRNSKHRGNSRPRGADDKSIEKRERRRGQSAKDITPVLQGWDYESGTINVRKISGADGSPKLQMRLDLGVLQMELDGRPDGQRPHGRDSLLDYFEDQLKEHRQRNGTELGFHLTGDECESLRDEAVMYYRRYLSFFVLGDFPGVVRDTHRNLRVLDLCGKFAVDKEDRLVLEQYRPYIIMMNARAKATIEFKERNYTQALATLRAGMKTIRHFFARFGQEEAYTHSSEVKVLRRFAREVRRKLPVDPIRALEQQLKVALKHERYEHAARLRDDIEQLKRLTALPNDVPGETEL